MLSKELGRWMAEQGEQKWFTIRGGSWGIALLLVLLLVLKAGMAQGQNDWSQGYIDTLARSWPENMIENVGASVRWSPDGAKRLSILQLGDSHVQSDFAAESCRHYLLEAYSLSGTTQGFAFPFGMARSNEPRGVRSHAQAGWLPVLATREKEPQALSVAGIAMDALQGAEPMRIGLYPENTARTQPREVSVLFVPGQALPYPMLNGCRPFEIDSSRGIAQYRFADPPDHLTLSLDRSEGADGRFRFLGFIFDDESSALHFHSAGLNGADVRAHLRNTMLPYGAEMLGAGIIIISLGTNDAYNLAFDPVQFRLNYQELIDRLQSRCPDALIILATPGDHLRRSGEVNESVNQAAEVIRNLAVDYGVGLWDFQRIMGGEGSIHSWMNQGLVAHDGIHFSPNGYRLQGSLLGVALYRMLTGNK